MNHNFLVYLATPYYSPHNVLKFFCWWVMSSNPSQFINSVVIMSFAFTLNGTILNVFTYIYFNYNLLCYWDKEKNVPLPKYSLNNRLIPPFYPLLMFFNQINAGICLLKKLFPNSPSFSFFFWILIRKNIQHNINVSISCWNFNLPFSTKQFPLWTK